MLSRCIMSGVSRPVLARAHICSKDEIKILGENFLNAFDFTQNGRRPHQHVQSRFFAKIGRKAGGGGQGGRRHQGRLNQQEKSKNKKIDSLAKHRSRARKAEKVIKRHNQEHGFEVKETELPPVFMTSTASPFVFVAKNAVASILGITDEENMPAGGSISLFPGISRNPPQSFSSSTFQFYQPHLRNKIKEEIPEIAFLGRSNVGKSSLANAIMNDDKLCYTSKSPGRTQKEYYYGMVPNAALNKSYFADDKSKNVPTPLGWIVDLPGYGFANAPDSKVDEWQASTQRWLQERRDVGTFQRLYLLIDARRGPLEMDRTIMRWMDDAAIPYTIVITKIDRVGLPVVVKIVNELCMRYTSINSLQDERESIEGYHEGLEDDSEYEGDLEHDGSEAAGDDDFEMSPIAQSPVVHLTSSKGNMGLYELMHSIDSDFVLHNE